MFGMCLHFVSVGNSNTLTPSFPQLQLLSVQELRSHMDCYTAMVIVGGGDDLVS